MRTLVGTVISNNRGKRIYCSAGKVNENQIRIIRNTPQSELEQLGFTFIKLLSLEYPEVRGQAIFFEGHLDEMERALKDMQKY